MSTQELITEIEIRRYLELPYHKDSPMAPTAALVLMLCAQPVRFRRFKDGLYVVTADTAAFLADNRNAGCRPVPRAPR